MVSIRNTGLAGLILPLCVTPCLALHPLVSDDTATQGRGRSELELTFEHGTDRTEEHRAHELGLSATLAFGLRDALDVAWTVLYLMVRQDFSEVEDASANGMADAAVEVKWRAAQIGSWSFGVKPRLSLPSGDYQVGLGAGKPQMAAAALLSRETDRLSLHFNVAYAFNHSSFGSSYSRRGRPCETHLPISGKRRRSC